MTRVARAALLLPALAAGACGSPEPIPDGPGPAAMRLFDLAGPDEPTAERLEQVFIAVDDGAELAALLDTLERLAGVESVELLEVEPPTGEADAFADLAVRLAGGGEARFTARVRASSSGDWRIAWFQGPGVEWPPPRSRRGASVSSSLPPGTDP